MTYRDLKAEYAALLDTHNRMNAHERRYGKGREIYARMSLIAGEIKAHESMRRGDVARYV